MKTLLVTLLLFSGLVFAQTISPTASTPTVRAGSSVTIWANHSVPNAAGLQWAMASPAGVTVTQSIGSAASAAGKLLACKTGGVLCLVYGVNQTVIGLGLVAVYTVAVPTNFTTGPMVFTLSATAASSAAGVSLPVTAGPPITVTVLPPTIVNDVNGDGVVNAADVKAAEDQALGVSACASGNVNGDAACNVVDVQRVVNTVLGLP